MQSLPVHCWVIPVYQVSSSTVLIANTTIYNMLMTKIPVLVTKILFRGLFTAGFSQDSLGYLGRGWP